MGWTKATFFQMWGPEKKKNKKYSQKNLEIFVIIEPPPP
jgi:hypothetical protein